MKKKINLKSLLITTFICLLPIFLGMLMYHDLPDKLPGHFNFKNEVDRYDPKWLVLFVYPLVMVVLNFVCSLAMDLSRDPEKKENKFNKVVRWFVPVLTCALFIMSVGTALNFKYNVGSIVIAIIAIFFILMGNYTPKMSYEDAKRTMNIVPKTEEAYKKLARTMGYSFVIGGIAVFITAFIDPLVALGILFGTCLVVAYYSIYYTVKS